MLYIESSHTCPRKAVGMAPKFGSLIWRDS
jgi:hypothetical protein